MNLALALLLAAGAHAAKARTAPELLANPHLPVYPSPFYAHPDFDKTHGLKGVLSLAPAPKAPIPLPPATIVPAVVTAPVYEATVDAMAKFDDLTPEQRGAVVKVAELAHAAKDVETLAQLALLIAPKERQTKDLLVEALAALKLVINSRAALEAGDALRTIGAHSSEPLPEQARRYISGRLKANGVRYTSPN